MRAARIVWAAVGWSFALTPLEKALPMTTVARGHASQIETFREVVVRTPDEWQALWREHAGAAKPPEIDFSTAMVVAVFLGTRPTSGYEVELVAIRPEGERLVAEYVELRPPPGAVTLQVLTSPFHIVRTGRRNQPVVFRRVGA